MTSLLFHRVRAMNQAYGRKLAYFFASAERTKCSFIET